MRTRHTYATERIKAMIADHVSYKILSDDELSLKRSETKPLCHILLLNSKTVRKQQVSVLLPAIELSFKFSLTQKEAEEDWVLLFYSLWANCVRLSHHIETLVNSDQTSPHGIIRITNHVTLEFSDKLKQLKKKYKKICFHDNVNEKNIYIETTDLLNHAIVSYQCFLSYLKNKTEVYRHKDLFIAMKRDINSYVISRSHLNKNNWKHTYFGNQEIRKIKIAIMSLLLESLNTHNFTDNILDQNSLNQIFHSLSHAFKVIRIRLNKMNESRKYFKLKQGESCVILENKIALIQQHLYVKKPEVTTSYSNLLERINNAASNKTVLPSSPIITSNDSSPSCSDTEHEQSNFTNPLLNRQMSMSYQG